MAFVTHPVPTLVEATTRGPVTCTKHKQHTVGRSLHFCSSFLKRTVTPRVLSGSRRLNGAERKGLWSKQWSMTVTTTQIADRSFQLQELEDSATCVSALYLKSDGSLKVGQTDGPAPSSVEGNWKYNEDEEELQIDLTRHYKGDNYTYEVQRYFIGHFDNKKDSDLAVFSGKIFRDSATDFTPDEAVGYFEMIIATDDLPDESYDITEEN